MRITDEMVEPLARFIAKPTEDDLWHWSRLTKTDTEYIEAHWRDYMDDARQYVELVAPIIAAAERAKWTSAIAENIVSHNENAAALKKSGDKEEARARELAASYLSEIGLCVKFQEQIDDMDAAAIRARNAT